MRSTRSVVNSNPDHGLSVAQYDFLHSWLEEHTATYNHPGFISGDPISVPHQFHKKQDIEIAGFFTAIMAWGQRKTIVAKGHELMALMDQDPHGFLIGHEEKDRKRFLSFKHRTLQAEDILYLVDVLQHWYKANESMETAFSDGMSAGDEDVYAALSGFHTMIFQRDVVLERTRKHISTPLRKSACKRLNMFLRWMVRSDDQGVDFGIWKKINPSQLIIPLDLHVGNVARQLGLLMRPANDWQSAKELTMMLKHFDANDPVRYDFALFGAGINP